MTDNSNDAGSMRTSGGQPHLNGKTSAPGWGKGWLDFATGSNQHMLWCMVRNNIRIKYQSSLLGFAWTLVSPLVMLGLLISVFTQVVRIPIENFWAFLVSGWFAWTYVNVTINHAASALEEHVSLVQNYSFYSETLLVAGALSRLIEFCFELVVIVLILAVFHHGTLPASFVLLPVIIGIQFVLTLGPMYLIGTAAAFNEDLEHMLPVIFLALFYATPIFYSVDLVPKSIQWIFYLNPIALLVMCYQSILYEGTFPPVWLLAWLIAVSVGFCVIGYRVFNRYRGQFAELV